MNNVQVEILKVENKVTQTGKNLKKAWVLVEGKEHPYKNVTAWDNEGQETFYNSIVVGAKLRVDIQEKDSGTPNPKAPGKNYIDRTLYPPKEGTTQTSTQTGFTTDDRALLLENNRLLRQLVGSDLREEIPEKKTSIPHEDADIDPEDIPF